MVFRSFTVHHGDDSFNVDYDTDDGIEVFKFLLFFLTSVSPNRQKIIGGGNGGDCIITDDSDLAMVSEELKLVAIEGDEQPISDEELEWSRPYVTRVRMLKIATLNYEDPVRQEAARKTVPVDELEEKAMISLAKEGNFKPSIVEKGHAFLLQLFFWFKQSFRWVNDVPCDTCGNDTIKQGMGQALPSEVQYGASIVELYLCNACSRTTRFPRYFDPLTLVETRRGRCGEWANCFTLYCRTFGYESRLIVDFTDHIWTECFSEYLGRWMHLDVCEGMYDKPLLYEGWNKKLNYVFAIAKDGVHDVTKRYTSKWQDVLSRRNITAEHVLSTVVAYMRNDCRRNLTPQILSKLEERDKNESEDLERDLHSREDPSVSLPGRQSGNMEWKIARSEIGSGNSQSLGCSSCPVRVCVDEHVTRIYNALFSVFSQFVKNSLTSSKVLDILKFVEGVLVDLKKSPYRTRNVSTNPFTLHWVQYFDDLLGALSLKSEIDAVGSVNICLAGDPVETALALPVALDAMVELISYLKNCDNLGQSSLSLQMKLNRIHSGSVLASGEELPFGIATSAFDGLQSSKWEEPDGARDGWILYILPDGQKRKLVAYDIVSANDAPERDPMDWIVEGSEDGGSTWHVLDKQTSQLFENRFQRKSFKTKAGHFPCDIFRFRFLAVRDVNSTSRLQLSSINLYTDASST